MKIKINLQQILFLKILLDMVLNDEGQTEINKATAKDILNKLNN